MAKFLDTSIPDLLEKEASLRKSLESSLRELEACYGQIIEAALKEDRDYMRDIHYQRGDRSQMDSFLQKMKRSHETVRSAFRKLVDLKPAKYTSATSIVKDREDYEARVEARRARSRHA